MIHIIFVIIIIITKIIIRKERMTEKYYHFTDINIIECTMMNIIVQ